MKSLSDGAYTHTDPRLSKRSLEEPFAVSPGWGWVTEGGHDTKPSQNLPDQRLPAEPEDCLEARRRLELSLGVRCGPVEASPACLGLQQGAAATPFWGACGGGEGESFARAPATRHLQGLRGNPLCGLPSTWLLQGGRRAGGSRSCLPYFHLKCTLPPAPLEGVATQPRPPPEETAGPGGQAPCVPEKPAPRTSLETPPVGVSPVWRPPLRFVMSCTELAVSMLCS